MPSSSLTSTGRSPSRSASTRSVADRVRPRYPDALVARVVAACPGPDVVDVGCGTGIAARRVQQQAAGCWGSSPTRGWLTSPGGPGSRSRWRRSRPGTAPDGRSNAVVAGQSWHWVDPVAGAAKAARVLRPGGRLAAFWHVFEPPQDVAEAVGAVYRRVVPDSPFNVEAAAAAGRPERDALHQQGGGRDAGGGRLRATRSSAATTGSGPTPGTSGSIPQAGLVRRRHPASAGQAGRGAGGRRRGARHDGRPASP